MRKIKTSIIAGLVALGLAVPSQAQAAPIGYDATGVTHRGDSEDVYLTVKEYRTTYPGYGYVALARGVTNWGYTSVNYRHPDSFLVPNGCGARVWLYADGTDAFVKSYPVGSGWHELVRNHRSSVAVYC